MSRPGGGLALRFVTALVVLLLALALIWVPALSWGWVLFVMLAVGVGITEYYGMARALGFEPETVGGVVAGMAVALSAAAGEAGILAGALFAGCAGLMALHVVRSRGSLPAMAASVLGLVYVGWFGAHIVMLHRMTLSGPGLVMVLIVAVVLTDVGAYFAGKAIGRHKLAPVTSPNKTWEGAAGGFVLAVAGLAVVYYLGSTGEITAFPKWSLTRYLSAGAILSVSAQLGDLAESSMKRHAGVKDSGTAFPGHGGVLDRCDGFLFGAPVLYYMAGY